MGPTKLSRRRLVATGASGLVAAVGAVGCGGVDTGAVPVGAAGTSIGGADLALARRIAAVAAGLVVSAEATARRHRRLSELLEPLAARHGEHVQAFTPEGETIRDRPAGPVPRAADEALRVLARAEERAEEAARVSALRATSGDLARAMASSAACMAQHARLLADAAEGGAGR